jgi:hypothetical protein
VGFKNASLPIIVARYQSKLKSVIRQIGSDIYTSEFEEQEQEAIRQVYSLVRIREQEAEGPSPLALDLQRRSIEVGKGIAGDKSRSWIGKPADDKVGQSVCHGPFGP